MSHTIVMTGATRGIGRVAAERLLADAPDAHLVVLARGGGAEALASASPRVTGIPADLASLGDVRAAADAITDSLTGGELPPLRGIVANAGLQLTNATTETVDGFEATFAVNVLANHVLVRRLVPHLTTPARIVVTVSDTHFGDLRHNLGMMPGPQWRPPDVLARTGAFTDPDGATAGRTAYATSKLAAIHLVHEYARRLPSGVDVVSFNPAFVPGTGLVRGADRATRFVIETAMPLLTFLPVVHDVAGAGRQLADVALGVTPAPTGAYVDRDRAVPSSDESYGPVRESQLHDAVERLTAPFVT